MRIKYFITIILCLALLAASCGKSDNENANIPEISPSPAAAPTLTVQNTNQTPPQVTPVAAVISEPLTDSLSRITLKPFGIKVSPGDSPVSPEKFSGYHVGTDFEASAEEQDSDVKVMAICEGKILSKRTVTGYGGLVTQSCTINGQDTTVLYGHIKLSSVAAGVGTVLKPGESFAVLGKGYSAETGNERKHLHLGIVKGKSSSEIRGYVQAQAELAKFMDAGSLLR